MNVKSSPVFPECTTDRMFYAYDTFFEPFCHLNVEQNIWTIKFREDASCIRLV